MASSSKSETAVKEMCAYCFDVLIAKLKKEKAPATPSFISDDFPLFVTWTKRTDVSHSKSQELPSAKWDDSTQDSAKIAKEARLRGCIGTFTATPLHKGLSDYAVISALRDHRFPPVKLDEVPSLCCGVSLLTNFEKAQNAMDWEVGTHGIIIDFYAENGQHHHATYLPEVASEQGWNKDETLASLSQKAGFYGRLTSSLLNSMDVTRYQSSKVALCYDEYAAKYMK